MRRERQGQADERGEKSKKGCLLGIVFAAAAIMLIVAVLLTALLIHVWRERQTDAVGAIPHAVAAGFVAPDLEGGDPSRPDERHMLSRGWTAGPSTMPMCPVFTLSRCVRAGEHGFWFDGVRERCYTIC